LGRKHSLNVATAGGVVIYELLRKYRRRSENARINR
jgi:tRNA G18 (ribose-2'-O)-methylase SpoU